MDLYDLYKTIVEGVAVDSELQTWASTTFGSSMSVYAGMPTALPDIEESAPFVVFGEPNRSCSQDENRIIYGCGAWLALSASGAKGFNPSGENELAGVEKVFDGMRLIRLAVIGVLPSGIYLTRFDEYADVNAVDTEVHGDMAFEFTERLTIGMDPMQ